jgi:hypothetical protein
MKDFCAWSTEVLLIQTFSIHYDIMLSSRFVLKSIIGWNIGTSKHIYLKKSMNWNCQNVNYLIKFIIKDSVWMCFTLEFQWYKPIFGYIGSKQLKGSRFRSIQ